METKRCSEYSSPKPRPRRAPPRPKPPTKPSPLLHPPPSRLAAKKVRLFLAAARPPTPRAPLRCAAAATPACLSLLFFLLFGRRREKKKSLARTRARSPRQRRGPSPNAAMTWRPRGRPRTALLRTARSFRAWWLRPARGAPGPRARPRPARTSRTAPSPSAREARHRSAGTRLRRRAPAARRVALVWSFFFRSSRRLERAPSAETRKAPAGTPVDSSSPRSTRPFPVSARKATRTG
mmetsp:Transcript_3510/g.14817  ORF Transcript_3510/g.14817 Transcript_3510/m.14817 type:complete len:237 (+) Transcript_3510:600-1310(+)